MALWTCHLMLSDECVTVQVEAATPEAALRAFFADPDIRATLDEGNGEWPRNDDDGQIDFGPSDEYHGVWGGRMINGEGDVATIEIIETVDRR